MEEEFFIPKKIEKIKKNKFIASLDNSEQSENYLKDYLYFADEILEAVDKNGKKKYLVCWKNHPQYQKSWETNTNKIANFQEVWRRYQRNNRERKISEKNKISPKFQDHLNLESKNVYIDQFFKRQNSGQNSQANFQDTSVDQQFDKAPSTISFNKDSKSSKIWQVNTASNNCKSKFKKNKSFEQYMNQTESENILQPQNQSQNQSKEKQNNQDITIEIYDDKSSKTQSFKQNITPSKIQVDKNNDNNIFTEKWVQNTQQSNDSTQDMIYIDVSDNEFNSQCNKSQQQKDDLKKQFQTTSIQKQIQKDISQSTQITSHFKVDDQAYFNLKWDSQEANDYYKDTCFSYQDLCQNNPQILLQYTQQFLFNCNNQFKV